MNKTHVKSMILCALFAAIICVLAPISFPIGPISITPGVFAVALAAVVLGWKKGTASVLLYIILGAAGLPVFSNAGGGIGKIVGITGGFITGYIPFALAVGFVFGLKTENKALKLSALVCGSAIGLIVFYAFAVVHYMFVTKAGFGAAMAVCVYPFFILDAVKTAVAGIVGTIIKKAVTEAKLM